MTSDQSASSQAFAAATAQMHANMNLPLTGDADVDFIAGMSPHHQGVITAQEAEIALMKT
ncbi:hypothetical protein ACEN2J_11730 [Pseudorhodobacter sp. W20_MBD10_FR17]|uniref:hypothetical protein n=1 Tax=Pseudorhodobacter sp. W20_MBD10_FR17 TaxID=3240266 RepID=UPI003F9603DB